MMRPKFVLLTLLCALPLAAQSDQEVLRKIDRFKLFNACRPVKLAIERLGNDETGIGLTKNALQVAAESRLRAARLYTEDFEKAAFAALYVNITVVGRAYSIDVQYKKSVIDGFGEDSLATTWDIASTGTHGGNAGFIVSALSQRLDQFLADYLRVNESACESR